MAQMAMLAGKVAIVTGAGGGIGRAEAKELAAQGAKVVVNDIDASEAEETARLITAAGGEAAVNLEPVGAMVTAQSIVKLAVDRFGRLVPVNNAGNQAVNPIDEMTEEQWDSVRRVHLKGAFTLIKYAIPIMKRQRSGVIINTSSEAGLGRPIAPAYCAAKEGLVGLTRAVAREQGRFGIRCNAIRPRAADTGLTTAHMDRWIPLIRALGRYWLGKRQTSGAMRGPKRLQCWLPGCAPIRRRISTAARFSPSATKSGFTQSPSWCAWSAVLAAGTPIPWTRWHPSISAPT